jgi:hypothetical protein
MSWPRRWFRLTLASLKVSQLSNASRRRVEAASVSERIMLQRICVFTCRQTPKYTTRPCSRDLLHPAYRTAAAAAGRWHQQHKTGVTICHLPAGSSRRVSSVVAATVVIDACMRKTRTAAVATLRSCATPEALRGGENGGIHAGRATCLCVGYTTKVHSFKQHHPAVPTACSRQATAGHLGSAAYTEFIHLSKHTC